MKSLALASLATVFLAIALRAGPAESAIVGVMKLADAHNYSWTTDVTDDARSYSIEGKTDLADKQDYSLVTMPLLAASRRGFSRGNSGTSAQASSTAIFRGDERFVLETPEGWKTAAELDEARSRRGSYGRPGGYGGPYGRGPMRGRSDADPRSRSYSNLQRTLSRPHEEIAIIVAGFTELKPEADGASGTLSETNAKLLLVHAGQREITPLQARGTFRLWLKDGELVRYQVTLDGKLSIESRDGRREVDVHQTATTTVRDVNTTTFDIPDAAKKKLG